MDSTHGCLKRQHRTLRFSVNVCRLDWPARGGDVLLWKRKVRQTRKRRTWSIRSTWPLSFLPLFSLLIWRGQTAKRWLRKPAVPWTAPTSPWEQSGNQEGIGYLISGINQVTILRCKGRQEGFPVGTKHVPTTTQGIAENRAGRAFCETMYHSHTCLFFLSQIVWLKEEVLSLVAIERRGLRKWNSTPHVWNDISSRNITMLTFHSVTQNDRSRLLQPPTSVPWEWDIFTCDSLEMFIFLPSSTLWDLTKQHCDLTPVICFWPAPKPSGQCWNSHMHSYRPTTGMAGNGMAVHGPGLPKPPCLCPPCSLTQRPLPSI